MTHADNKRPGGTSGNDMPQGRLDPQEWRIRLENALDFPATVREALDAVRAASIKTLEANEQSRQTHDWLLRKKMEVIERELDKPDLTREDRDHLMAMVDDLIERANAKDEENRRFLAGLTHGGMNAAVTIAGLVIGTAGVVAVTAIAGPDGLRQVGQLLPQIAQRALRK